MAVLFFILAAMQSLAPGRDHAENATAIATVVLSEPALFRDDESRMRTAAFMVSVAFRESSLRNGAIGDHGNARCMFQLWNAPSGVLTDPELCARIALVRMRESARACGKDNMLGLYAVGPKGCSSEHAKRISRDRRALAERLAKTVQQ
ncbi:MAG TPA: hypothetical protein VNJ04_04950 [Gemmatimonadaceae bacterium]|nr:hypothetical protein [Gemmatimonadaceae bacterium]